MLCAGKRLQLEAATGTQYEYVSVARHGFGKEHRGHLLKAVKARNLPDGAIGVTRDSFGIGKRRHDASPVA
jgi:hypothetical protein